MAYQKQTWKDLPDQTTPLSASRLAHMETQYEESVGYTDHAIDDLTDRVVLSVQNKTGNNIELTPQDLGTLGTLDIFEAIDSAISGGVAGGVSDPRLLASLTSPRCVVVFTGSSTTSIGEYPEFLTGRLQQEAGHGSFVNWDDLAGRFLTEGVFGVNAGASGKGVSEYLGGGRLAAINGLNPSIVIHSIGAGDWKAGRSPEWFKEQYDLQINSIVSSNPLLHILVHQHERTDVTSPYTWDEFKAATQEVSLMGDNRVFIDVSEDMRKAGVGVGLSNPYGLLSPDDVHLTSHGHQVLASLISKKLGIGAGSVTQWVDLSSHLNSAYSAGYIRARKVGGVIEVFAGAGTSESLSTGNTVIATLPKNWVPPWGLVRGSVYFTGGYSGTGYLSDTGSLGISQQTGASRSNALAYFIFPVGGTPTPS